MIVNVYKHRDSVNVIVRKDDKALVQSFVRAEQDKMDELADQLLKAAQVLSGWRQLK